MSLKDLYHEILKTQQDIAITYGRVVGVESALKKKMSEENKTESIELRLDAMQRQLDILLREQVAERRPQTPVREAASPGPDAEPADEDPPSPADFAAPDTSESDEE